MTKPLNPDLKAIRAFNRALGALPDDAARKRCLEWVIAFSLGIGGYRLPEFKTGQWRADREGDAG